MPEKLSWIVVTCQNPTKTSKQKKQNKKTTPKTKKPQTPKKTKQNPKKKTTKKPKKKVRFVVWRPPTNCYVELPDKEHGNGYIEMVA